MPTFRSIHLMLKVCFLCLFALHPVWADDTEIYFSSTQSEETRPNLLFVLDISASMNAFDCADGSKGNANNPCPGEDTSVNGTTSRLDRMVDSLKDVIDNTTDVNVGLMRFSHEFSGGRMLYPISNIDQHFCNDEPCGANTVFDAETTVLSSTDDAIELLSNNEVIVDVPYVPLMSLADEDHIWSGLRFDELPVPQGATIVDARIDFTSIAADLQAATEPPNNMTFYVEDTADAEPFAAGFNTISNRSRATDTVPWHDVPEWSDNETVESPNLAPLVQHVVSKADWCGGNAIGLSVRGNGSRLAASFDRLANDGPVLRVRYRLDNLPEDGGCIARTLSFQVENESDDAREALTTGAGDNVGDVFNNEPLLRVRDDAMSGFSFANLPIPQGTAIHEAYLTLRTGVFNINTGTFEADITVEDSGNPAPFSLDPFDLSSRTKSTPIVLHNPDINPHSDVVSEDLSSLITTVINKADWTKGNRINIFLKKSAGDGRRAYYGHRQDPDHAAKLTIRYNVLDQLVTGGKTPTVGALLEAKRYLAGENVVYGKFRAKGDENGNPKNNVPRYSRVSHPDTYTGGEVVRDDECQDNALNSFKCRDEKITGDPVYISPVTHECQPNHIILLTDGDPTEDPEAVAATKALTGGTCVVQEDDRGTCGIELAEHLNDVDLFTNQKTGNSDQTITTHAIGFNFSTPWLRDVANKGGGGYFTASTANDLTAAISTIVSNVERIDSTFVAPGATIDQFSRLSHREDVYMSLFKPNLTPSWIGNVKKYNLKGSPPKLLDMNANEAVDPDTGTFVEGAKSFWSATADGNNIELGGAASRLDPQDRRLYTKAPDVTDNSLTATVNRIAYDNDLITNEHLNVVDDTERESIISWLHGVDVKDEDGDLDTADNRYHMGDPLHSRPVIVTYGKTADDEPDSVVFIGTNEGFIHAISSVTGDELYAYMPIELVQQLRQLYDNVPLADHTDRPYGMDGNLTLNVTDQNQNGVLETGDSAILYAGMRRGGRNYYALDVSEKNNPKFKWQITGGSGNFKELGETWSKPINSTIRVGDETKSVLIFGGGYDSKQDDHSIRTEDSVGRAIYIVDADNPETIIWSGSGNPSVSTDSNAATEQFDNMRYSFPSDIQVVNNTQDGTVSQMYVGDTGGQIWRFDVNNGATGADLVDGGVVADLATDNDPTQTRRFYHPPDLSLSKWLSGSPVEHSNQ